MKSPYTATGANAEIKLAREGATPHFLLAGYSDGGNKAHRCTYRGQDLRVDVGELEDPARWAVPNEDSPFFH